LEEVVVFDKQSNAHDIKSLDRWQYWMDGNKDNQAYLNLLNDDKLLELSEKIYGKMPFNVRELI